MSLTTTKWRSPSIDIDYISRLGGFEDEGIAEIIGEFLSDAEMEVHDLAALCHAGDRLAFREAIHRMKSAALMSGCAALGEAAARCEDTSVAGDPLPEPGDLRVCLTTLLHQAREAFAHARAARGAS